MKFYSVKMRGAVLRKGDSKNWTLVEVKNLRFLFVCSIMMVSVLTFSKNSPADMGKYIDQNGVIRFFSDRPNIEPAYSEIERVFEKIQNFGAIIVDTDRSAKDIGLDSYDLSDYLKLLFVNRFKEIKYKKPSISELKKAYQQKREIEEIGVIHAKISTVGENYPVAYNILFRAGNWSNCCIYESGILGYTDEKSIQEQIKKALSNLVDELAIAFLKAKDEL